MCACDIRPTQNFVGRARRVRVPLTVLAPPGSPVARSSRLLRLRAWVLYHLSPCDKSVWACMRNPHWWLLNAVGLIPGVNHLWWLLLLAWKDKRDEYQLCDFIIGSEASRFFRWVCTPGEARPVVNAHVLLCWSLLV